MGKLNHFLLDYCFLYHGIQCLCIYLIIYKSFKNTEIHEICPQNFK